MTATVHFLPWEKIDHFNDWIASIGAFDHIAERDFTAIKIHFGEKGNQGYIRPQYTHKVAEHIKAKGGLPFLTDANTIYVGQRADAVRHLTIAAEHEYTLNKCGCPVIIADGLRGNSGVDVPVALKHFQTVSIANAVHYADSLFFMSHFKGHEISGFGGTLKNAGMGCGTRAGKYAMHDSLKPAIDTANCVGCGACVKWCAPAALSLESKKICYAPEKCVGCGECILSCAHNVFRIPWNETTSAVQEKIVEYAYGVLKGKKHFSINFINHVTQYCDCYPSKGKPLIPDIGVMASADPVALDLASADIVNERFGSDFWKHIFPEIDRNVQLAYAHKLGLGELAYTINTYKG